MLRSVLSADNQSQVWRVEGSLGQPDGALGCGLCEEELPEVWPEYDWTDYTQVYDVAISRRRSTGSRTLHLNGRLNIKYRREDHYLSFVIERWLATGLDGGCRGTIYVTLTPRQETTA